MRWPTPQDYNEAIQNPLLNFADEELRNGAVELDALGLPRPVTGAFASVYKMNCADRAVAVRCFLRRVPDQQERYRLVSDFVLSDRLPYTVDFEFVDKGIRVGGSWYPILKMEWVEGLLLPHYIENNLQKPTKLEALKRNFITMMSELAKDGIAHGDLQHGNIIMVGDSIRLVDYDGMFVPALESHAASELGHRNYQHPARSAEHFGPYLDNFSAAVIYASLTALQVDPGLWSELSAGDECLLFRAADYKEPFMSRAFAVLENHEDRSVRTWARHLRSLIKLAPDEVPCLKEDIADPKELTRMPDWHSCPDWVRSQLQKEDRGDTGDGETTEEYTKWKLEAGLNAKAAGERTTALRNSGSPVTLTVMGAPPTPLPSTQPSQQSASSTPASTSESAPGPVNWLTDQNLNKDAENAMQVLLALVVILPIAASYLIHMIAQFGVVQVLLLGSGMVLVTAMVYEKPELVTPRFKAVLIPISALLVASWMVSLSSEAFYLVVQLSILAVSGVAAVFLAVAFQSLSRFPAGVVGSLMSQVKDLVARFKKSPLLEFACVTTVIGLIIGGTALWPVARFVYMLFVVGPALCWFVFYWFGWRERYAAFLSSHKQIVAGKQP